MLNHLIKTSKTSYYTEFFNKNRTDIKSVWRGIRNIISLKPMGSSLPSKILLDDAELTDSKDIANAFNDFFINVGYNLSQSIPSVGNSPLSYMPNRQIKSFFIQFKE